MQPVAFTLTEQENLSAALISFSPTAAFPPPSPPPHFFFYILCSSSLPGAREVKMMQEVSIMVAYDAHVVDRPGDEDTLACLVAHSRPLRTPRPVVGLFSGHLV